MNKVKCKHRDKFGPTTVDGISRQTGEHVTTRCYRCNAAMPLGPANDADPNVAIEIRAAEIARNHYAMEYRLSSRFKTNWGEVAGWRGEETIDSLHVIDEDGELRIDRDVPINTDSANYQAGYLARCIATHKDQP